MEDRLNYNFPCAEQAASVPGIEKSFHTAVTVSQNIAGSSVQLHVPAIANSFIDTSEFYVRVTVQVVNVDGTPIPTLSLDGVDNPGLDVFPLGGFLNNLWSQCNVRLNGHPLPPTSDYPYVAQLLGLLGTSPSVREHILTPLSGGVRDSERRSLIGSDELSMYVSAMQTIQGSQELVLYGRIQSDFLVSLAQLLPDNVDLDIELTRGRDSFALGSTSPDAEYRIKLNTVTLFVKRIEFNSPGQKILRSAVDSGVLLKYNRYQSRVMFVPKDSKTFNWGNIFSSGALPRRVFFFLVDQSSYSGAINRRPTFCEPARVSEVRFMVDGRDVMPEPYRPDFVPMGGGGVSIASDVKSAVLGLNSVMGSFHRHAEDSLVIGTAEMLTGAMIYATNLDHVSSNQPKQGSLDISATFKTNAHRSYTALCIGEFDQCVKIAQNGEVYLV